VVGYDTTLLLHYNRFTALWILSGTTQVSRYQKKRSSTHTHCGHQSSLSASSISYDPANWKVPPWEYAKSRAPEWFFSYCQTKNQRATAL